MCRTVEIDLGGVEWIEVEEEVERRLFERERSAALFRSEEPPADDVKLVTPPPAVNGKSPVCLPAPANCGS